MKNILLFPIALLTFSCCSTNKDAVNSNKETANKTENPCPENVDCNFEIIKNRSLNVKTDDLGKTYYELTDNPEKVVFKYKYDQVVKYSELQDAGYTEEIVFELNKDYTDFSFSGKELQNTKMLFKVMCFCRGKAGSYKVTDGTIVKKGNTLSIKIPKIVDDQKITDIKINL